MRNKKTLLYLLLLAIIPGPNMVAVPLRALDLACWL